MWYPTRLLLNNQPASFIYFFLLLNQLLERIFYINFLRLYWWFTFIQVRFGDSFYRDLYVNFHYFLFTFIQIRFSILRYFLVKFEVCDLFSFYIDAKVFSFFFHCCRLLTFDWILFGDEKVIAYHPHAKFLDGFSQKAKDGSIFLISKLHFLC